MSMSKVLAAGLWPDRRGVLAPKGLNMSPSAFEKDGSRSAMGCPVMRHGRFDPQVIKQSIRYAAQKRRRRISCSATDELTWDGSSR